MERWLARVLSRVRELGERRQIRFTYKAFDELRDLRFDVIDACEILCGLTSRDCVGRHRSEHTGEWMYIFKPRVSGSVVYVKLLAKTECIIVSFHEEVNARENQEED